MDLPSPTETESVSRDALLPGVRYVAPDTLAERRLAGVWQAALKLDRIGADDDFFALGGDSLAATVICTEAERLVGHRVEPSLLLDAPTVALFAAAVEADLGESAGRMLLPIRSTGQQAPLVLVHGHDGQVFFVRRLAWLLPPDRPVWAVQARGMDGASPPHETVQAMAEDYAAEILRAFGPREIFLGGYCMGGVVAIEVLRHLVRRGGRVRQLFLIDPPPEPRRLPRELTAEELSQPLEERRRKLARRFAAYTAKRPDLAAHYAPGGQGLTQALAVAKALRAAYARYSPTWTRLPATILWSVDRAAQLSGPPHAYTLTRGPTRAFVVRHDKHDVTHAVLLRNGVEAIAALLERSMTEKPASPG